ncbi:hypothetical protein QNI22_31170 [Cytophagaceae bacterium BD1B2-1]|uniref:Uncharacterized protein n=1 Tax=Xanthocytophaga agilis TaxID=3048010 RepID=A0AAE3RBP2_9BACT|nr:hypothetical protein [Xanthocytophaga agilis]
MPGHSVGSVDQRVHLRDVVVEFMSQIQLMEISSTEIGSKEDVIPVRI